MTRSLLCRLNHTRDGPDHTVELGQLPFQLLTARGCYAIKSCSPVVFRLPPLRRNPTLNQQALQCRVERAFFNLKHVFRHLMNMLGNTVTMHRTPRKRLEDQHIEGSGWNLGPARLSCPHSLS